jgi:hypothetical protein
MWRLLHLGRGFSSPPRFPDPGGDSDGLIPAAVVGNAGSDQEHESVLYRETSRVPVMCPAWSLRASGIDLCVVSSSASGRSALPATPA